MCLQRTDLLKIEILLIRPGRGKEYCDQFVCMSVFLSLCVSVCPPAYWNRWTDLHEFFVQISCGRGSVRLWRRCDKLCTSGFIDDVVFGRSGPYGDAWKAEPLTTASNVTIPGRSLMSVNALLTYGITFSLCSNLHASCMYTGWPKNWHSFVRLNFIKY